MQLQAVVTTVAHDIKNRQIIIFDQKSQAPIENFIETSYCLKCCPIWWIGEMSLDFPC